MANMMLVIEIGRPFQLLPGHFSGEIRNKKSYRVWWLYFAIAYLPISFAEYTKACNANEIGWEN